MSNFNIKYFLAANSAQGFISYFNNCYSAKNGWRCFIIKGGPGTGKSSFMKYLAAKCQEKKLKFELCPCSSDPDSLDAIIIPQKKIVVLDGTAPHTVDPSYAGVCEEVLNFGQFWDKNALISKREKIVKLTDKNKALHRSAARYLEASAQVLNDTLKIVNTCTEKEKTEQFALKLCKKYIPKQKFKGEEQIRFLNGITPKGIVSYANTAINTSKNQIIIEDKYGVVANEIMQKIRDFSLNNGYNIITIKNSLLPNTLIDHIIIPELSLSFLREYEYAHFSTDIRRIHARRFISLKTLKQNREQLKFNKKTVRALLESAVSVLQNAKKVHDLLENEYISCMDFNSLTEFCQKTAEDIL